MFSGEVAGGSGSCIGGSGGGGGGNGVEYQVCIIREYIRGEDRKPRPT